MIKEICHVCKKEKKPYTILMKNDALSFIRHLQAREDGPICERCNKYYAMTGEFKDATEEEFKVAQQAMFFSHFMLQWWEKDKKLADEFDENINKREWDGTIEIAKWCREHLMKNKHRIFNIKEE